MKIAYCIDKEGLGGGCEYIRRKCDADLAHGNDCKVFYSDLGECCVDVIDSWGADLIVVNHLKALLQLVGRPWNSPRARVRFVVHGIHLRKYEWQKGLKSSICYLLRKTLERWLYHRCDEIVALTESDRQDIFRLYGRDLKVCVEPNTLDGWQPMMAEGLPPGADGTFEYICIGRFSFPKGQDRWIRKIRGRTLFIGDGDTLAECKSLADKLGVKDLCVFAGAIPNAERYLKCAKAVVSPSRWEGMPYLMMKARAIDCRILATDCPGNRDVLAGYAKWETLVL